ncbi:unnamed protein product, partial [Discosporangium mesarthrocarpum]
MVTMATGNIQELVRVLQGRPSVDQLIAILHELNSALTMASGHPNQNRLGGVVQTVVPLLSSNNNEVVLISVRALITCIDISPRASASIVVEGAAPPLCQRLLSIEDMDVAEACLKCLSLVSQANPRPLLEAGAAKACVAFFEFFPLELQQMALATVARLVAPGVCCKHKGDLRYVTEVLPFLHGCLKKCPPRSSGDARGRTVSGTNATGSSGSSSGSGGSTGGTSSSIITTTSSGGGSMSGLSTSGA